MRVSHDEDYVNEVGYLVTSSDQKFLVERMEEDVAELTIPVRKLGYAAREIYVDHAMISTRAVVVPLDLRKDHVDYVDYADFPDCS